MFPRENMLVDRLTYSFLPDPTERRRVVSRGVPPDARKRAAAKAARKARRTNR